MKIRLHREFEKRYKRLRIKEQHKFKERRDVFLHEPFHPILNNHALHGKYRGYRSIDITGDLRVIFEMVDNETAYFVVIGTHSELYS